MKPTEFQVGQTYHNTKYGDYVVKTARDGKLEPDWVSGRGPAELDAEIQARMITNEAIRTQGRTVPFSSAYSSGADGGQGRHHIESWRLSDPRWWTTVGFLAKRLQSLTFEVPTARLGILLDELALVTTVPEDHKGIYTVDHDKWGSSSAVQFKADQAEVNWLRVFFAGLGEISPDYANQDGTGGWSIKINDVTRELLALGFCIGEGVDVKSVRQHIPAKYLASFERGLTGNLLAA